MRFGIFAGACLIAATFPVAAWADGTRFGGAGQLVISDDQPIGFVFAAVISAPSAPGSNSAASFEYGTVGRGGGSGIDFSLSPAADFFVVEGLSVGADVFFGTATPPHGITETSWGIAPRVGYNLWLCDTISFWPKAYFGYAAFSAGNNDGNINSSGVGIFAPFLFHPVPHFFLGIGPNFFTQLSNNVQNQSEAKATQVGVQATFGGWFLGGN
jgi:hypothetical protein